MIEAQDCRHHRDIRPRFLGVIAFVFCLFVAPVQAKEPLTLLTGVWAPFINEDDAAPGVMTEVVLAAFESIDQQVQIKRLPWERVRRQTDRSGAVSFGWSWGRETPKSWYYSDTLMTGKDVFAVRRDDSIQWDRVAQLTDYRIGVVRGYHLPFNIDAIKDQLNIIEVPRDENLLRMLLADRVDMVVINPRVARHLMAATLEPEQADAIRLQTDKPIVSYTLHLVCQKTTENCAETVLEFNEGLRRIRNDGTWHRIVRTTD